MVATALFEEIQVTVEVLAIGEPSVFIPEAVNWSDVPLAMLGLTGVIPTDDSVAAVTVNVVESVLLVVGSMAEIVRDPTFNAEASPLVPAALLILATELFSGKEDQVTDDVTSCVERSEYIPVALNCSVVPLAILRVTGVTTRDESVASVTVNVVTSVIPVAASVALIVVVPTVNVEAYPVAGSMVATELFEEIQDTDVVFTTGEPSELIPEAVNCNGVPFAMLGLTGVIPMDKSVAPVTVIVVKSFIPVAISVAVILVLPTANALATP